MCVTNTQTESILELDDNLNKVLNYSNRVSGTYIKNYRDTMARSCLRQMHLDIVRGAFSNTNALLDNASIYLSIEDKDAIVNNIKSIKYIDEHNINNLQFVISKIKNILMPYIK